MLRFVDLTHALEEPCFAFFDTVTGKFLAWYDLQMEIARLQKRVEELAKR